MTIAQPLGFGPPSLDGGSMSASRLLPTLALVGGLVLAAAPTFAQTLDSVSLTAEKGTFGGDPDWFLNVGVEGSTDVTSASVTPPGQAAIPLECSDQGTFVECDFEDPDFASLAELLATYPSGTWVLELNESAQTASLDFSPVEPDGVGTVTDPLDGATDVNPTPTVSYDQDCTNCAAFLVEIDGVGPIDVSLERVLLAPLAASGSVPYADFESSEGPKPSELPDGQYHLTLSTVVGAITTETLAPGGDDFDYETAGIRNVDTFFTVPEPGAAALGVALAAALARRRRRAATRPPVAAAPSRDATGAVQPSVSAGPAATRRPRRLLRLGAAAPELLSPPRCGSQDWRSVLSAI